MAKPTATSSRSRDRSASSKSKINAYHVSAVLLLFFAITHTFGGLFAEQDYGPSGNAVFLSMKTVRFDFFGFNRTLHDFHLGFGLIVSVYLVCGAALAWQLARHGKPLTNELQAVATTLLVAQAGVMLLAWKYFFLPPMVVSTVITATLAWARFA